MSIDTHRHITAVLPCPLWQGLSHMVVVPAKRARLRRDRASRDPVNETFVKEPTARLLDSGSRAPGKRRRTRPE
jgi:hypothetical protein